jgi:hypothetical protein
MAVNLPLWANSALQLQTYPLINKAIVEAVGTDVPTIALARNQIERKELIFEQALTFLLFFLAAPAHAWAYQAVFRRLFNVPKHLMALKFSELGSLKALKNGLKALPERLNNQAAEKILPWSKPKPSKIYNFSNISVDDSLRKRTLWAKASMWAVDLMTVCALTGSIGFVKNKIGELLTGTKHFTGEIGVTSKDTLDKLYYQNSQESEKSKSKKNISPVYIASVLFPLITGLGMIAISHKPATSSLGNKLKKAVDSLDHHRGIFISLPALFGAATVFNLGLFAAARSPNERREVLAKKIPMQATFFLGDLVLMFAANYRYLKKRGLTPTSHIRQGINEAPVKLKTTVGKRLAKTFWGMFALNTALVGGLVVLNNQLTTKRVQRQATSTEVLSQFNKLNWSKRPRYNPEIQDSFTG